MEEMLMNGGFREFNVNLFLFGLHQKVVTIGGNSRKAEKLLRVNGNNFKTIQNVIPSFIRIIHSTALCIREKLEAARDMEFRGVIHDIKGFMTGVLGQSEIASMRFQTREYEKLEKSFRSIRKSSSAAGKVIRSVTGPLPGQEELLDEFDNENQEFRRIFSQAIEISQSAKGRNVIVYDNIPTKPIIIKKNCIELLRVLMNIFNNAFEAMSDDVDKMGKIQVLNVSAKNEDRVLSIRIADNGKGMTPEVRDRIFEEDFGTKDGWGVGLHSCKELVEKNFGGTISVEGLDTGTAFNIRIPL